MTNYSQFPTKHSIIEGKGQPDSIWKVTNKATYLGAQRLTYTDQYGSQIEIIRYGQAALLPL